MKGSWLALVLAVAARAAAADRVYDGEVVPRDFTPVCAPVNTLRVPGWGSSSNSIHLQDVQPEEAVVKEGAVVAVFRFGQERARQHLEERAGQLKSQRDEALMLTRKSIQDLQNELSRLRIEREKLRLDLLLATSLARIKQKLLEYDYQLKALEADAAALRLTAATKELAWSESVHAARIRGWESNFGIFDETRARYTVKAAAPGRLFYPTLESSNRKVRKGDDMNSGTHFLSIVMSDRAQVRFWVPEEDRDRVALHDVVTVGAEGPRPVRATVSQIDYFPQYVGDARRNFRLPSAWEKCFVVLADLSAPFSTISRKEVTVKLSR